jgi:hypothetical protein
VLHLCKFKKTAQVNNRPLGFNSANLVTLLETLRGETFGAKMICLQLLKLS